MRQNSTKPPSTLGRPVRDIHLASRKQYSAEQKIRIVLDVLSGEGSVSRAAPPRRHRQEHALQRVEGIPESWQAPADCYSACKIDPLKL